MPLGKNEKIIKLKIFQEKAVFRTPYSMEVIETYPLPPSSTIIGFIHNIMSRTNTIKDINISIQGKYGNLLREFVSYHKFERRSNEGKLYPIIITSLIDLELIIHIKMPSEELHKELFYSLQNPPSFPYLGRPEDLITQMEVLEDSEENFDPSKTERGTLAIPYDAFIPFELAKGLEIEGVPYLIPGYYTLRSFKGKRKNEIFRNFEMIKVIYAQKGQEIEKAIKIDGQGIPIWWMK